MANLKYVQKNGWEKVSKNDAAAVFPFCEQYRVFLDKGKTERECVHETVILAEQNGFKPFVQAMPLKAGDKVYAINRDKGILLAIIGKQPLEQGVRIIGSHIDAPRIDLKQNPLYEADDLALFKTHYYGGIKKYQWMTVPLAIHGVVVKADGSMLEVVIGEADSDPVFCITDLLPHLAQEQMQKKMSEVFTGESLNLLVGSMPEDTEKEKVKEKVLTLLNEKYGMCEEDFVSAELELVPAQKAKDVGFDRSMLGGYGHDDRVCSYAALMAILALEGAPNQTAICLLVDKEEVGSMGNTGMQSAFMQNFIAEISNATNGHYNDLMLRRCLAASKCLSADVNAAVDSTFDSVFEKRNCSFVNRGIVLTKFTGSRGKSGGSDANAEFVGEIRNLLNKHDVLWQTAELGKVDMGGGGTIAQYVANLGVDVLDCGVALLSMHAPFEVAGKLDIYMSYKAFKVFYEA
ncbi:MAG: aminopeptidase [Hyphomonadaceae bacterium]|nr:aminopeptidase [Clostridia bacterium]